MQLEKEAKQKAINDPSMQKGLDEAWNFARLVVNMYSNPHTTKDVFGTKNMREVFDTPYSRVRSIYDAKLKEDAELVVEKMARQKIEELERLGYKVTAEKLTTD